MKKLILSVALLSTPLISNAAGFAIIEHSASGMGNAFAGASAVAEDASTVFFNPAGMVYIDGTQILSAIHFIKPQAKFNDQGSVNAAPRPLGGNGGNAGDLAFVPNLYYKRDLTDTLKFGLSVNSPFGLKTHYESGWLGRFQALKSSLKTVNINPALAFKVNDQLSVGFGVSAMWVQAELTSAANLGASEADVKIKADDWGFGYNFGAIYQATKDTRVGISYRSKVKQSAEGSSQSSFTALDPDPTRTLNTPVLANVTLPETLSISGFSHVNEKWDLLGDITWTKWSKFQELRILRDNGSGSTLNATTENWHNTLRYSVGANYHYSDTLKLRAGLAYDEEAIDDEYRTARIPGNDRKWLTFGAGWKYSANTKFDIGYAHLFVSDTPIDDDQRIPVAPSPVGKGQVKGSYEGSVDILSIQMTHNF